MEKPIVSTWWTINQHSSVALTTGRVDFGCQKHEGAAAIAAAATGSLG